MAVTGKDVTKSFGEKTLFRDLNFHVRRGERLVVAGPNGSGKTTLLNLIQGTALPDSGTIALGTGVVLAGVAQNPCAADLSLSPLEICGSGTAARTLLACLKLRPDRLQAGRFKNSAEESAPKLPWARVLSSGANLLLLDEPTNPLEIEAQEALEQALQQYPGTVIVVSHDDSFFLDALGTWRRHSACRAGTPAGACPLILNPAETNLRCRVFVDLMPLTMARRHAWVRTFALCAIGAAAANLASAQIAETVLYNFPAVPNGSTPYAPLIRDAAGNLFGTASAGGLYNQGVVFEVDASGNEKVLYNFTGAAGGAGPHSGLFRDAAGNLYGAAGSGGAANNGTLYKLDAAGKLTVLHTFHAGPQDGQTPGTPVVLDGDGNLWGTTQHGGAADRGVVYKLNNTGQETVVHSFAGGTDGAQPMAGLTLDAAGNLYGTTAYGGYSGGQCRSRIHVVPAGCGVVFKIDAAGNYSLLYSFGDRPDGEDPEGA